MKSRVWRDGSKALAWLTFFVAMLGSIGLLFLVVTAIVWFMAIGLGDESVRGVFAAELCFAAPCLGWAKQQYGPALQAGEVAVQFSAGFAAVFGVLVAARAYLVSLANARLQSHSANIIAFKDYVAASLAGRGRLSVARVDVHRWYSLMFPNSILGSMAVGSEYRQCVERMAAAIVASNKMVDDRAKTFSLKVHQSGMMDEFDTIGVEIRSMPRLDYLHLEDEVFLLVRSVELVFNPQPQKFAERSYRVHS